MFKTNPYLYPRPRPRLALAVCWARCLCFRSSFFCCKAALIVINDPLSARTFNDSAAQFAFAIFLVRPYPVNRHSFTVTCASYSWEFSPVLCKYHINSMVTWLVFPQLLCKMRHRTGE